MTKRLILIRHAKSSWENAAQPDHERPLNLRGQRAATAIGEWIETRGYTPDTIVVSTATRTLETCDLIIEAFGSEPRIERVKTLYHASADHMLEQVQAATGETVMIIGHNPGCAQLSIELAQEPPAHDRFGLYPTTATTVFDFDIEDWSAVTPHTGLVRDFVVPKDLGID